MALYPSVLDLIGDTPLVDISALSPNPRRRHLHQAGGAEPRRLGQGPGGAVDDRAGRARRRARAGQARPGADGAVVGQHRHRPGHGVPGQGLPPQGGHADQRVGRAPPAARAVGGRDHRVARAPRARTARCAWPGSWPASTPSGSSSTSTATRPTPRRTTRAPGPRSCATAPTSRTSWPGSGTSGTLLGVGRFLREKLGDAVQIWAVEPPSGEMVDGLRNLDDGYIPPIFEELGGAELLDRKTVVRPRESIEWTRRLTDVGVFAGISTGAAVAGAVKCAASLAPRARRRRSWWSRPTAGGSTCRPGPGPTTSTRSTERAKDDHLLLGDGGRRCGRGPHRPPARCGRRRAGVQRSELAEAVGHGERQMPAVEPSSERAIAVSKAGHPTWDARARDSRACWRRLCCGPDLSGAGVDLEHRPG